MINDELRLIQTKTAIPFQAVKQFIDLLSSKQNQPRKVTPETAIQYLSARKFDVPKAVALFEANVAARHREGLFFCDSSVDPLRSELESAKFTVLVSNLLFYFLYVQIYEQLQVLKLVIILMYCQGSRKLKMESYKNF